MLITLLQGAAEESLTGLSHAAEKLTLLGFMFTVLVVLALFIRKVLADQKKDAEKREMAALERERRSQEHQKEVTTALTQAAIALNKSAVATEEAASTSRQLGSIVQSATDLVREAGEQKVSMAGHIQTLVGLVGRLESALQRSGQ